MEMIPYVVAYVAIGIFVVAVIARFFMWAKMPLHVRWELYPVAHEPAHKLEHGGSYLEEVDWWKKPRETSLVGELKEMIPEILFLVALKEHNPGLWLRSWSFHFGIYLVIGATALLFGNALLYALAPSLIAGGLGTLLRYLILLCAVPGLALGLLGALGLLQRRLSDPAMRDYAAPADLFNLAFFVVAFGVALVSWLLVDRSLVSASAFVQGLITFRWLPLPGDGGLPVLLPVATVVLLSLLVAYIPLTHMSHFVGKYFAYHAIRWNDTPNLKGGDEEAAIGQVLGQPVTWAAPHIHADGKKNWVDLATEEMKK